MNATGGVDTTLACTRAHAHFLVRTSHVMTARVAQGLAAQVLSDSQNSVISSSCLC